MLRPSCSYPGQTRDHGSWLSRPGPGGSTLAFLFRPLIGSSPLRTFLSHQRPHQLDAELPGARTSTWQYSPPLRAGCAPIMEPWSNLKHSSLMALPSRAWGAVVFQAITCLFIHHGPGQLKILRREKRELVARLRSKTRTLKDPRSTDQGFSLVTSFRKRQFCGILRPGK
jgi:hypothetical protein